MKIIQSPTLDRYSSNNIFLAGGISNCPDWQKDICDRFLQYNNDITIFNPRRITDLAFNTPDAKRQIEWEDFYLDKSKYFLFWFPKETVCPITLFELGKWTALTAEIYGDVSSKFFIGMHPEYTRRFDLEVQLPLIDYEIKLSYSLDDLFERVVTQLKLTKDKTNG